MNLILILLFFCNILFAQKSGYFVDARDGKKYKWIKIGEQVWMAENLAFLPAATSPYDKNIQAIRNGQDDMKILNTEHGFVLNYFGDNSNEVKRAKSYKQSGVLYNFASAKNSCPDGWHLPSDDEWSNLESAIEMKDNEIKLTSYKRGQVSDKIKSIYNWPKDLNGTNEYGFNAIPSGVLFVGMNLEKGARFVGENDLVFFWTADERELPFGKVSAIMRGITNNASSLLPVNNQCIAHYPLSKSYGLSV